MTMMMLGRLKAVARSLAMGAGLVAAVTSGASAESRPAKELFGAVRLPNHAAPAPYGSYAKGCMSGGVALATDGPTWQAMRLSRNRRWGHPELVALLERFSRDAASLGWGTGILVGDISQPRGGPMLFGHASHQVGLDADIWFTPKPAQPLTVQQREDMPFTSMLDKSKFLTVDSRRWSNTHAQVVVKAASYPQVERVFVNPAIKKKLCDTWTGDRAVLGKIRPVYGHDEHFHIRMRCPQGASGCKPQAPVPPGDGCGKGLAWWFSDEPWAPPKKDPNAKPAPKPRPVTLSDLPAACAAVLKAPDAASESLVTFRGEGNPETAFAAPIEGSLTPRVADTAFEALLPNIGPVPASRPLD